MEKEVKTEKKRELADTAIFIVAASRCIHNVLWICHHSDCAPNTKCVKLCEHYETYK